MRRFLWGAAGLLSILIAVTCATGTKLDDDPVRITYSQFRDELAAGNVDSATVVRGTKLRGRLKAATELRPAGEDESRESRRFTVQLPIEGSEGLIEAMEARNVVITAAREGGGVGTVLLDMLPWLLILGFLAFVVYRQERRHSQIQNVGEHQATRSEQPDTTFDDVAGVEEAKEDLEEIVEFLRDPTRFTRLGGTLPKGALLVGPPGTGKTLLARAVAGEASVDFLSLSGSQFVEMFVGVGAKRVRGLFERARKLAPCIIFIDELDAVGRSRGGPSNVGGNIEREQTLNQLLVEMDGFEASEGIIMLAATNRPDVLDPALLRPGRFDRQIVVGAPDVRGREGILRLHTRDIPLATDVDFETLARATPGLSGAELENVVNEAALAAARRDGDAVAMRDFEAAKDRVMLGVERTSMVLSERERRLTAYHEAGHAIVALRSPDLDPVHKVTIVPRGLALGVTASVPEEDRHTYTRSFLTARIAMILGGRAAEELVFGAGKITTGAGDDLQKATDIAQRMVTQFGMSGRLGLRALTSPRGTARSGTPGVSWRDEVSKQTAEAVDLEIEKLLGEGHRRAIRTLREAWPLLEAMAERLLEDETLDREQVEELALETGYPARSPDEGGEAVEAVT